MTNRIQGVRRHSSAARLVRHDILLPVDVDKTTAERIIDWPNRLNGGVWREVAPGVAVPERFKYWQRPADDAPDATLHIRLVDGQAVCERLELEARPGVPLNASTLRRLPLAPMLRAAPLEAARRITFDAQELKPGNWPPGDGWWMREIRVVGPSPDGRRLVDDTAWLLGDEPARKATTLPLQPLSSDDRGAVQEAVRPSRKAREAIPMDDDGLRRVAELYRTAIREERRNPTIHVAETNHVSRMTASRWIRRARDRGFLEPAPRS